MNNTLDPKFSIILPIYNVEKYLKVALDNLKNQTFSDFEAICVNDGSPDNSLAILEEYAKLDSRFKIINQENQGQGAARNNALKVARGEYIMYLDPDDFWSNNTLEEIYSAFTNHDVDIVQFNFVLCEESDGKDIEVRKLHEWIAKNFNFKLNHEQIFKWNDITKNVLPDLISIVWDKAYTRKFLIENNIKCGENRISEDVIFSISSTLKAKSIIYLNNVLYHYRMRAGSVMQSVSKNALDMFDNIVLIKRFLDENKLMDIYNEDFQKLAASSSATVYERTPIDLQKAYIAKAKETLSKEAFKQFKKIIGGNLSLLEKFISFKNRKIAGQRYKVIRFFFLEFKVKINH